VMVMLKQGECRGPSFPRMRESRLFIRLFLQGSFRYELDSRLRGNDGGGRSR
jgi:hypothetical protein